MVVKYIYIIYIFIQVKYKWWLNILISENITED